MSGDRRDVMARDGARYRIGIDIGGTFTDFVVVDAHGRTVLWKEDSNPADPIEPVRQGLTAVAASMGLDLRAFLARTSLLVHGTTIATNVLIQRNGPRLGLLATEGFRDVLYLRDGYKPERFNVHLEYPKPLVDRYLRLAVRERIDRAGKVRIPLDEASVAQAAERFRQAGVEAVAIGFLWSVVNPDHERRAAELLERLLPGVACVCSSDVVPEIREWQRISATTLSAYVLPKVGRYLASLEEFLFEEGYPRGALIMQINGGCASIAEILRRPVNILASGPAAAPAAARFYFRSRSINDIVAIDMGGTSLDVTLVRDGQAIVSREIQVEHQPIGVPGVEVLSIGAGGGSIAWIDSGGALRVGPRSAGARPGPVAYDAGGVEPTVTDANLVLGYLDAGNFLGGRRRLNLDRAAEAIEQRIAGPLGLSTIEAAAGIIRIVNANMLNAIRSVSVQRGIDVRRFTLLVGGGAGGLHGAELARALEMTEVLIPAEAGTLCAFGMTATDVRCDETAAHFTTSTNLDLDGIEALMNQIEAAAVARLAAQGFSPGSIEVECSVDARYPGQVHEITVPIPAARPLTREHLRLVEAAFHARHQDQFTWSRPGAPIEYLHWRAAVAGKLPATSRGDSDNAGHAVAPVPTDMREIYNFGRRAMEKAPVFDGATLQQGARIDGPAVIQTATTTIIVGDNDSLTVGRDGGFSLRVHGRTPSAKA